jgi:hypothetical protein
VNVQRFIEITLCLNLFYNCVICHINEFYIKI